MPGTGVKGLLLEELPVIGTISFFYEGEGLAGTSPRELLVPVTERALGTIWEPGPWGSRERDHRGLLSFYNPRHPYGHHRFRSCVYPGTI